MKLIIPQGRLNTNYPAFLRQAGYLYITDHRQGGKESFVRSLARGNYPRFHLYVGEGREGLVFNLHLDQKQASYQGHHMHNAEYDGELVNAELSRLAKLAGLKTANDPLPPAYDPDAVKRFVGPASPLGHAKLDDFVGQDDKVKKKPWWKFWI